ncbi:alpha/beta fold hydrolase [Microbacterium sp. NPDC016588]
MPTIDVEPGIHLHYEDRGEGKPLVFVHGWGGSGDAWDLQVLDLADRYRVITVDLRGHGASDKPWGTYDYRVFTRDLHTLIERLELEDVTLVGWSMGGQIVLRYAADDGYGISRVVTTGSGPRFHQTDDLLWGPAASDIQGLIDAVRFARTETIAGLYGNNFHRTDLDATRQWFIQIGWLVPAFVGVTSFEALVAEDLRSDLAKIPVPVHYFHGRHDIIWAPEWARWAHENTPGSTLTYFENSGHVAFIENRIEWNAALVDAVEGRTPAESLGVDSVPALVVG